jgi:predicted nucleic acid-binding Zn ribbon protein
MIAEKTKSVLTFEKKRKRRVGFLFFVKRHVWNLLCGYNDAAQSGLVVEEKL